MGSKSLTRREFILGSGLSIALALKPNLLYSQTPKKIDFNTALSSRDSKARQNYLDYLVNMEPSPHVNKVYYDHDRKIAKAEVRSYIPRTLDDPDFLRLAGKWYMDDPKFANIDEKERYSVIRRFINSSEGKKEIEKNLREETEGGLIKKLDSGIATTLSYPLDFGKGVKPNIYAFGAVFEPSVFNLPGGTFRGPPSEEKVRTMLQHEYVHARHKHQGVELGGNAVINSSNFTKVDPQAFDFFTETAAYFKQIDYSRQFGINHPAYISSILGLVMFMNERGKYLKPENFNPFDRDLIGHQMKEYKRYVPEILNVLEKIVKTR